MSSRSLEELVAAFVERREAGEDITAGEFAAEHPDRGDELLVVLERAQVVERTLREPGLPTERLGPYRVLDSIGTGGMGRVFRAVHDDRPGEEVALKVLSPLVLSDERARARFEREGRALARLDHPGVVRVLDHGLVDGIPYLAMEWVRGRSLAAILDEARSEEGDGATLGALLGDGRDDHAGAAAIVARLARAVAAVHASGVLHRDIKPHNVILSADAEPVLVDFGLARSDESVSMTATGDVLGTPRYMAPEQARGEATDERTDVHGLGVTLYELLTLEPAHPGGDPMRVLRAVSARPVTRVARTIPEPLRRVVRRACAFRPQARYATVAELADDLEAFLAGKTVQARNFGPLERLKDAWSLQRNWVVGGVLALVVLASLPFLRDDPPDLAALVERAALAYAAEDMAGTAAAAQRILAHAPDHPTGLFLESIAADKLPLTSSDPCTASLIEGMTHRRARVWPEALASFEAAAKHDPESPLPAVLIELVHQDMDEQQRTYELELASDPDSASTWYQLGRLQAGRGRYVEAEAALLRTVAIAPQHWRGWTELAVAQHFQGRDGEALASALRGGPKGSVRYARTLLKREEGAVASHVRRVLDHVLDEDPGDVSAMVVMAWSYDYEHDISVARQWYERALDEDPDHLDCLFYLAYLLSGGTSDTCDDCAAWFAENPEHLDLGAAEELLLRMVEVDRGRSDAVLTAAGRARSIGRTGALVERIEGLLAEDGGALPAKERNRLQKAREHLER